jgi:hypothetical protein
MTYLRKLGLGILLAVAMMFVVGQCALAAPHGHGHQHHQITAGAMNEVGFFAALAFGVGVYLLVRRHLISHE